MFDVYAEGPPTTNARLSFVQFLLPLLLLLLALLLVLLLFGGVGGATAVTGSASAAHRLGKWLVHCGSVCGDKLERSGLLMSVYPSLQN